MLSPVHQQQHAPAPESNSQCCTQFHSLADPLFQLYRTMCIPLSNAHTCTHTHTSTQTMGGTVLIAFCTALKGWPPGSCSPSIGFITVALHPSSCCLILETYFCYSSLLCKHSSAPTILNLSPCVHLSCHQMPWCYFTSAHQLASCLYVCPRGRDLHHNLVVPCPPKISSIVYRWSILFPPFNNDSNEFSAWYVTALWVARFKGFNKVKWVL